MKIYQIHGYGGAWEDYFDIIVSSYLSEEKAIIEKERLEKEEELWRTVKDKCIDCPLYSYNEDYDKKDVAKYCNEYEPFDANKHDENRYDKHSSCVNYTPWHEDIYYKIEEVEVIE